MKKFVKKVLEYFNIIKDSEKKNEELIKETPQCLNLKPVVRRFKATEKKVKYYYVIGSSQFLLKNEPLEEMLRERAQFLKREKKSINFWLVKSPKFLNSSQLSDMKTRLLKAGLAQKELTAIVSVDPSLITWLKLRLQNVGKGSFITDKDIFSPLASDI